MCRVVRAALTACRERDGESVHVKHACTRGYVSFRTFRPHMQILKKSENPHVLRSALFTQYTTKLSHLHPPC